MTKTLTEQWREGTLKGGYYYIKTRSWGCDDKWHIKKELEIDYYDEEVWSFYEDCDIYCVGAPVPSYDEYKELTKRVGRLELDNEVLEDVVQECNKRGLENKKLQEQLKEANAIIDLYFPKDKKINAVCVKPINDYRKKWGVK